MPVDTPQEIIAVKTPQFAGDPREDDLIELAKFHVSETAFKDKFNYALALVVCHWYTLESRNGGNPGPGGGSSGGSGTTGGIQRKDEGDLRIDYHELDYMSTSNKSWGQTTYGQEFISLRQSCIISVMNRCV